MENFLSRLNRNPYAPIDSASITRVDELGNGYDDFGQLIAPKFQAPEQTWGETALGVATAPARMTMGLVESLSPYGAGGWQIPPIVNEGVNALTAVGDAYTGKMPEDEINSRALGMAGFMMGGGGLAARPAGGTGMFAGRLAKTADQEALARAERLAAEGADRNAIWNETGWFQGPDQKWRFEIDDSKTWPVSKQEYEELDATGRPRMGQAFKHDNYYWAYPEAKDQLLAAFNYEGPWDSATGRYYEPKLHKGEVLGAVAAGNNGPFPTTTHGRANIRSTALHELQHDAQFREGFARGAAPSIAPDEFASMGLADEWYRRNAGEVEARNVQTRMNMTPEQRRATPPWETQDIPFEDQIVRLYSNSDSRPAIAASGLDMSQEARLARARDMGFDTDSSTYRGLRKPYDPDTAKSMYYQMFTSNPMEAAEYGSNVVEAYLRKGRNLALDAGGRNFNSVPTDSLPPDFGLGPVARTDEIAHKARQAGYDSVTFNNVFDNATDTPGYAPKPTSRNAISDDDLLAELGLTEDDIAALASSSQGAAYKEPSGVQPWDRRPTTVDVIFDPKNIRSVNAAFDPAMSDSTNILAANADSRPALLAGAIGDRPTPDNFANNVLAAAKKVKDRMGDRVPINKLYEEFAKNDMAGRSLDTFKKQLVERGQSGMLELSRADLPEKMPGGKANLSASETKWGDDAVHYLRLFSGGYR